jgi:sialate O-acetylesterase
MDYPEENMVYKEVDRRWFMRSAASSALVGLGMTGWAASELRAAGPQAIWNQNAGEAGSHKYPGDKEADIWVFSGQSNSQGWGMLKAPVEPDPRILFFNADNDWVIAKEPLNPRFPSWMPDPVRENILLQRNGVEYPSGAAENFIEQMKRDEIVMGGVGPGLAFARHLVNFIDRPLGLVYCGVGGSPIKSWDPTVKGSNYEAMIRRIAVVGGKIKGMIWYQGESDAMTYGAEDVYEAAVLQLFDSVRKDTGLPQLPILCVQLGRFVWNYDSHAKGFEKIRDIQRRLPSLRPNVYTVSALDLPLEDAAHISFEGQQRLGRRLAELALSQVYGQADHGKGIGVKGIEVLQPENRRPMVRVRFSGVSGKLRANGLPTGFELRSQLPAQEPQAPAADAAMPVIYRVDFDPRDGAAVILGVFDNALINSGGAKFHRLQQQFSIVYGPGMSPYVNIVDEMDMPIPAFGPLTEKG